MGNKLKWAIAVGILYFPVAGIMNIKMGEDKPSSRAAYYLMTNPDNWGERIYQAGLEELRKTYDEKRKEAGPLEGLLFDVVRIVPL
ncbi:MAG: hypothetical protein PHF67_05355 [Candidatus Nanoarchaeia archaeon]|nr:hypothetical protein [Candidatus Nanoarchaeia archaeon]